MSLYRTLHGIRRRASGEAGMSLTELMVAMIISAVVLAIFFSVLSSVQSGVANQQQRADSLDQARLAIQQLDREIRSGNVLYDPATESPAYYSLRIYSQNNAPTRTPSYQCVQWKITGENLKKRSWPPDNPAQVSSWRTVATGIVNIAQGVHAFTIDPDPLKSGRTVDVVFAVNSKSSNAANKTLRVQTALTGRDTIFGYPSGICDPAPAG